MLQDYLCTRNKYSNILSLLNSFNQMKRRTTNNN
jgi:hypothetical protein